MKAIADSSFLMMCIDYGKGLLERLEEKLGENIELVVPDAVRRELGRLARKAGRKGTLARGALKMLERAEVLETYNRESVDGAILELAKRTGYPVITVDKTLARLLKKNKITVITFTSTGKPHAERRLLLG